MNPIENLKSSLIEMYKTPIAPCQNITYSVQEKEKRFGLTEKAV